MSKKRITSETLKLLLDKKYRDSQKSLIAFEVSDGTGAEVSRRADAVSFELWPSNNYIITGYEIKVSRSDWLSEMKQPEKSIAISQYCDHWYLVAPQGVLGIEELPNGWGYIQASEKSLRTKIKAPKRETVDIKKQFVASLLRKCIDKYSDKSLFNEKISSIKKELIEEYDFDNSHKTKRLESRIEDLEQIINGFLDITGIQLNKWNYARTAEAITALNSGTIEDLTRALKDKIQVQKGIISSDELALEAILNWPRTNSLKKR